MIERCRKPIRWRPTPRPPRPVDAVPDDGRASGRLPATATAAAALLAAVIGPALGQVSGIGGSDLGYGGIQPELGTDPRVGDLRPQLESFLNPTEPTSARPAWVIDGSVGLDLGVTDNARFGSNPKQTDVYGILSPSVVVSGDTSRLKVNLSYAPQGILYANTSSQNQLRHFFNGQALGVIVPDAVFLDVRGSITQTSLTGGGFSQANGQTSGRQNDVQTIAFAVTPYVEHRFNGWGTGRLQYTFSRSIQDTYNNQAVLNSNQAALNTLGQPGYGSIGNLSTSRELATFNSGENLGRFNDQVILSATQYSGVGVYHGAYRREVENELNFALNRSFTLLTGLGYQNLSYGTTNSNGAPLGTGYHVDGPTYNIGLRYAPTPDTSVSVEYGRHDGQNNVTFFGQVSPTARTRVVASYSTGITSDLEQSQNQLGNTNVGPSGYVTDRTTGAPVLDSSFSGVQNGLYRLHRLSASLLFLQDRDTWSANVGNDDRTALTTTPTLVGAGVVPAGLSTNTTYAGVSWQHDLSPDLSLTGYGQYGISTNTGQFIGTGRSETRTLSLSAVLSKRFTETLTGNIRYIFTDQSGGQIVTTNGVRSGNYTQNTLLVGLRKSF